jgi:hypothetical protein
VGSNRKNGPIMRALLRGRTEKNRGLSADLGSYHDGALPGSRVEDPLSQTQ